MQGDELMGRRGCLHLMPIEHSFLQPHSVWETRGLWVENRTSGKKYLSWCVMPGCRTRYRTERLTCTLQWLMDLWHSWMWWCACTQGVLFCFVFDCNLHSFPIDPTPDTLSLYTVFMCHYISLRYVSSYLSGITNQLKPFFPDVWLSTQIPLVSHTLCEFIHI